MRSVLGRSRTLWLGALAVVTGGLGLAATGIELDWSNASMHARDAAQAAVYREFRDTFGNDEVVIVSLTRPDLLSDEGLRELARLTREVESLDGVTRVLSLTNAVQLVADELGVAEAPLVALTDEPVVTAEIEAALARAPYLTGVLISADRRTAGIALEIDDRPDDDRYRGRLVQRLRRLKSDHVRSGNDVHLTGITVQKYDTTRLIRRDQLVVLPLAILVMSICLAATTRRVSGVLLPLLVTGAALLWTLGFYRLLGYRVNIITSLLPPVVLVLSVTTGLHVYREWLERAHRHRDSPSLVRSVLAYIALPVVLTCLTTAIGLAALAVSDVPAVRQFGMFAATGVVLSMAFNLTLLPAVLAWLPVPRGSPGRPARAVTRLLTRAADWSIGRPGAVLITAALVSLLLLPGIARIRNNTDLIRFLDPDTELVRDTLFIDRHLTGSNSLEWVVSRTDGGSLTGVEDMRRIEAWTRSIAAQEPVTNVLALPQLVAQIHQADRQLSSPAIPKDPDDLLDCFDLLAEAERRPEIRRLVTPDFRRTRVNVRVRAIGTSRAAELLEVMEALAERHLGDGYRVTPTGNFYLVTLDSNRLVDSQVRSFGAALTVILLLMGSVFRSWRLLLAALIPNLVPIAWTAGLMGWTGIDLSTATTMVASIVLGIAVDGTIHYLVRFRRQPGRDTAQAIRDTTHRTGRVLLTASLVISFGFWVGALGSFRPTVYFSLLTGVTILGALLCDLLMLPACLMLVGTRSRR